MRWVENVNEAKGMRRKLERASGYAFGSALKRTLFTWRRNAEVLVKVKVMIGNGARKLAKLGLKEWRTAAVLRKTASFKGELLSGKTLHGLVRTALDICRAPAKADQHLQQRLGTVCQRCSPFSSSHRRRGRRRLQRRGRRRRAQEPRIRSWWKLAARASIVFNDTEVRM